MHDNSKESLSALLDSEADELEIRRLLNASESSDEIKNQWQRYHLIGDVLRTEVTPDFTLDLSTGINQALDGKPMDELPAKTQVKVAHTQSNPSWLSWIALSSSAAAVTLAVFLGLNLMSKEQFNSPKNVIALQERSLSNANMTTVSQASLAQDDTPTPSTQTATNTYTQQQLQAAQKRLNDYLIQHIEDNAMHSVNGIAPLARAASLQQP